MNENSETFLKKYFYQKLYDNIEKKKKKVINKSIIFLFSDINSNERFRLLSDSTVQGYKIPKDILSDLLSKNLIRHTDKLSEYTITAKGIWEIESKNNAINTDILLEYLDRKFFSVYNVSERPLSDREKVILFSMIAARTFSEKSSVNLKKDRITLDTWKEIIDKSHEKLKSLNLISNLELYGKIGNEHPVSSLFRRANDIPKKTRGVYVAPGTSNYFLDLFKDSNISNEKLSYLFKQIFGNKALSYTKINEIYAFCCDIAYSKSSYVFDPKQHIFSKPEYDEVIRDNLLSL